MAVAEHLHGVISGEEPIALLLMDRQVLIGVIVVHIPGHVEPDAAHGVHDLANGLPLHDHLVVRLKAHQLGDLLIEILDPLLPAAVPVIDGVDALDVPGDVHHGVPGDRHHRGLLVGHVIAGQQHGVRVAAASRVPPQDQDRVVVVALPLPAAVGADALTPVDLLFLGVLFLIRVLVRQLRPDKQALAGHHRDQNDGQYGRHRDQQLLLPGQPAGLFRLLGLVVLRRSTRQMLSAFSVHCLSILSTRPAPRWWRGAQGFPYWSSLRWSSPGPSAGLHPGLYNTQRAVCLPPENPGRARYSPPGT